MLKKTTYENNYKLFLLLPFILLHSLIAFSQTSVSAIKGKVLDEKGNPLAAVSVNVKGTSIGTSTANDGSFSINITGSNATLSFSYIGYSKKEISTGI